MALEGGRSGRVVFFDLPIFGQFAEASLEAGAGELDSLSLWSLRARGAGRRCTVPGTSLLRSLGYA